MKLSFRTYFFIPFLLIVACTAAAQTPVPKQIPAKRIIGSIIIDGDLNDTAWKNAPMAKDFVELRPHPFKKESILNRTEVYFLYSDEGLYIGGYCHEATKDSISTELAGRDGFGNNDFIGIVFDTYKDKLNGFEYFTTPLGEQMDAKFAPNSNGSNEDFSWNAVWKSAAKIQKDGWTFEIFLPLSAIRFSTEKNQDWGVNIVRRRQKSSEQLFWNPVDPNVNGFLTQEGFWTGLENIKPPIRLQFSPYFSTYMDHYPYNDPAVKNTKSSLNGGMDVKYGINQSFTLDMTLIPDFGQVQSDNQVLNLTPFEVKYNENRSFFTEGTELFTKGNLFYSRRVGGMPIHHDDVVNQLNSNEHIVNNPTESRLLNASKISGRTRGQLGIGFFNAVTEAMYATVEDDKHHTRTIQTTPLTNYNIFVLDQSLKHNSSVSFINTNVMRSGSDYDADVSAFLFDLNNKKNTYEWQGKIATSSQFGINGGNTTGYSHKTSLSKTSGRFTFQISQELLNDKYDINDLGILSNNNYLDHYLYMGYKWIKPTKWYNSIYLNFNLDYTRRFLPSDFQSADININVNGQLKNLGYAFASVWYDPTGNDFYEPRTAGRVFRSPEAKGIDLYYSSNTAKKYSYSAEFLHAIRTLENGRRYDIRLSNKYRFNNKLSVSNDLYFQLINNSVGYADNVATDIIFGRRDLTTVENIFNIKYNFTKKIGITTRIRHYWSKVDYKEYFTLLQNGDLGKNNTYTGNANNNYNAFNIDAVFTWEFAPGSFINIVWKNAAYTSDNDVSLKYFADVNQTLKSPQDNNLSLKVLFFIDYLKLKQKHKLKA
jgi:hypothetical protein